MMKTQADIQEEYKLLDQLPIGVFVIQSDYKVIFWNACIAEWTRISKEDIMDEFLHDHFPQFNTEFYKTRMLSIFEGELPVIFSSLLHKGLFTNQNINLDNRALNTIVKPVESLDNNSNYALFTVEDVSSLSSALDKSREMHKQLQEKEKELIETNKNLEKRVKKRTIQFQRAKEKAEESDRLKSSFLANMSHEIRTPMNSIIGFSEILEEDELESIDIKRYIKVISTSGHQLLKVVNNILDISKIEVGQIDLHIKKIKVHEILEEMNEMFQHQANLQKISLIYEKTSAQKDCSIKTDEVKFRQILINLISNAIKFTHEGQVSFGFRLEKDTYEFYVGDTGIGIDKKIRTTIYNPFHRGVGKDGHLYQGTGLGLSITKAYVEFLQGKIWCDSEVGKGTTFYFVLPKQNTL